jgi:hypothetical protein
LQPTTGLVIASYLLPVVDALIAPYMIFLNPVAGRGLLYVPRSASAGGPECGVNLSFGQHRSFNLSEIPNENSER